MCKDQNSVKNRRRRLLAEDAEAGLQFRFGSRLEELARIRQLEGQKMATLAAQQAYQCAECGNPDIVAVPMIYQQGTRTFSGIFNRGVSQSVAAQQMAPPRPRTYFRVVAVWGALVLLSLLWTVTSVAALTRPQKTSMALFEVTILSSALLLVTAVGLFRSAYAVYRYNRETYRRLLAGWSHSFMCKRCGKLSLVGDR